jgi:hypothetical protein
MEGHLLIQFPMKAAAPDQQLQFLQNSEPRTWLHELSRLPAEHGRSR